MDEDTDFAHDKSIALSVKLEMLLAKLDEVGVELKQVIKDEKDKAHDKPN
jgi:hypothetical protein